MKVIIAGTRTFKDYTFLKEEINRILREKAIRQNTPGVIEELWTIDCIVSGGAEGADKLGEKFAKEYKIPCVVFSAKWSDHGRAAGPIRNAEMADYADCLIAFWNGQSSGTADMIEHMRIRQKELHVIQVDAPVVKKRSALEFD